MKLRIQQAWGLVEAITLVPPFQIRLGNHLNCISDASGIDHYFTPEGYYDGWGSAVNSGTPEEAQRIIERIEGSREIDRG